jgi:hypothetical protein
MTKKKSESRPKPRWGFDFADHYLEPLTFTPEQKKELGQLWRQDPDTGAPIKILDEESIDALIEVTIYQLDFYKQFEAIEKAGPSAKDNKKALDIIQRDATILDKHFREMGADLEMEFFNTLGSKEWRNFRSGLTEYLQAVQQLCERFKPNFQRKGGRPRSDLPSHLIQIHLSYDKLDKNLGGIERPDLPIRRFLTKSLEFAGVKHGNTVGVLIDNSFDHLKRWRKAMKAGIETDEGIQLLTGLSKPLKK